MKQLVMSIPVWFAKRDLHERRADFYYDLASTLKDRVPLFTTIRKLESRAQQRTPLSAPMYLQMLKGLDRWLFVRGTAWHCLDHRADHDRRHPSRGRRHHGRRLDVFV